MMGGAASDAHRNFPAADFTPVPNQSSVGRHSHAFAVAVGPELVLDLVSPTVDRVAHLDDVRGFAVQTANAASSSSPHVLPSNRNFISFTRCGTASDCSPPETAAARST